MGGCSVAGATADSVAIPVGSGAVLGAGASPGTVGLGAAVSVFSGLADGLPFPFPLPPFVSPGSIMSSRSASGTAVSLPPATTRAWTASDGPTHSGSEAPRTPEASPSFVSGARMPKSRSRQSVQAPSSALRVRI
ncbi:hypothetical protein GCM10010221_01970 [Streptomyces parvus]|nr:hypothetical protein GCM10010221_01970 [Streptomyces parvus]